MSGLTDEREDLLSTLQADAFKYFVDEVNPDTGLVVDSTKKGWPSSIAAVGMALSSYPVGVGRGLISREEAIARTLKKLRFFASSEQSASRDATGYKGFYYHFLDMQTGRRAWQCELSTIDTTFLFAGMLAAAAYFDQDSAGENEIRTLADELYRRADWRWATNESATLSHGWRPETGFLSHRWTGYDESMLAYILGLGSPTFSLDRFLYTSSLTSGSTSVKFRMRLCVSTAQTTLKTVVALPMHTESTRGEIQMGSRATTKFAGDSLHAKGLVQGSSASMVESASSLII